MAKRISLFNHKGGVSKTTTTFNLGWMLAKKGKRVLLVDCDPQCNLTGMFLGFEGMEDLEEIYNKGGVRNLRDGLAPAFESKPVPLEPVTCEVMKKQSKLLLLPGHIGIAEYETTLGIAQELSGSLVTLQNLPGAASRLLDLTTEKYQIDNFSDSAVAMSFHSALFCANAVSNAKGDLFPRAECSRSLL
jgi:cellulose biosynthesis protein BcsQ